MPDPLRDSDPPRVGPYRLHPVREALDRFAGDIRP